MFSYFIRISVVCHSYVIVCYRAALVCRGYMTRCTLVTSVCHPYTTRICSYVVLVLYVGRCFVFACHPYVIRNTYSINIFYEYKYLLYTVPYKANSPRPTGRFRLFGSVLTVFPSEQIISLISAKFQSFPIKTLCFKYFAILLFTLCFVTPALSAKPL